MSDHESDPVLGALRLAAERSATPGPGFDIVECDPELADTAAFCAAYGYGLDQSANAIVLVGKAEPPVHAMCLVLATTSVDVNKVGRKKLGTRKASFAPAEVTADITGMTLGGVTPFGKPDELRLWIDSRVMECERVIVGGGDRGRKFLVDPLLLTALPGAEVVEHLAKERPPAPG